MNLIRGRARLAGERTALSDEAAALAFTAVGSAQTPRHWTINGDFLGLRPAGVARYAREVVLALDDLIAQGHPLTRGLALEIVAPCEPGNGFRPSEIPVRVVREYRWPRLPQLWVQLQLPGQVRGGLVSFCNLAPVVVRKHIVCIHDLHTRLAPESYAWPFRWAHRVILPVLGRRAAAITTVSEFSRDRLVEFGVARPDKIAIAHNGADHAARWDTSRSSYALGAFRPFVFCLGQPQRYKNLELLLKLLPALDEMGLDLCMAGDIDATHLMPTLPQIPGNLRLLGRVGDADLAAALAKALCFLFPSRIEGFGLPAIEAMALGCPVVASRSASLPEVCGDAALYAGPDDVDAWAAAVRRIRTENGLRARLVRKGRAQAGRYSWRSVAETYLQLMAELDADKGEETI